VTTLGEVSRNIVGLRGYVEQLNRWTSSGEHSPAGFEADTAMVYRAMLYERVCAGSYCTRRTA